MAGIYIHIPFCSQKCSYCDFHFSTDSSYAERMVNAIGEELAQRSTFLSQQLVETIYFGGGTPSLLEGRLLKRLMSQVNKNYSLANELEITLEANPEDLNESNIDSLINIGINRLSIGVQSFDDKVLRSMNRAHSSEQALKAIQLAQSKGIQNISVDIIYGVPDKDMPGFSDDLAQFIALDVPHISAYALTIEKGTVFHHLQSKGELNLPEDEVVTDQFQRLRKNLFEVGYDQYEVSNFAKEGYISKHNSAYWSGKSYIGIGPSAHSYDGESRYWNVANNFKYMKAVEQHESYTESEYLSLNTRYNEYILTRTRTKWGLDLDYVMEQYQIDVATRFSAVLERYNDYIEIENGHLVLNEEGLFIADGIASELFILD